MQVENGIYLSPRRSTGKKSNYKDELRDAQILRDTGSTVYLTPEDKKQNDRQYDAIVDGLQFEFKNVGGNANTLKQHFLKSRSQAPNVFINIETSDLTKQEAIDALYEARNSATRAAPDGLKMIRGYAEYNRFSGGKIILKIKGHKELVAMRVNKLKAK